MIRAGFVNLGKLRAALGDYWEESRKKVEIFASLSADCAGLITSMC